MPINSARATVTHSLTLSVQENNAGLRPTASSQNFQTQIVFNSTGAGAGAFNQQATLVITIPGGVGKTATLDFYAGTITGDVVQNLVNLFNEQIVGANAFARVKEISVELLGAGANTNGVIGTAASKVTVGPASNNPWLGPFGSTTDRQAVLNGGRWANGSAGPTGWVVGATASRLSIVNQDGTLAAVVRVNVLGSTT